MKVLDIDMDYFLEDVPYSIPQECTSRVSEDYKPWNKEKIIDFIENNLGLSTNSKIKGKIVQNHHEALYYWNDLVSIEALRAPFEVIHVDSHADLGLGFASQFFIFENLFPYICSIMHSLKIYFLYIFINFFACFFNSFSFCSYTDYPSTVCNQFVVQ